MDVEITLVATATDPPASIFTLIENSILSSQLASHIPPFPSKNQITTTWKLKQRTVTSTKKTQTTTRTKQTMTFVLSSATSHQQLWTSYVRRQINNRIVFNDLIPAQAKLMVREAHFDLIIKNPIFKDYAKWNFKPDPEALCNVLDKTLDIACNIWSHYQPELGCDNPCRVCQKIAGSDTPYLTV
eukprot:g41692.t1